MLRKSLLRSLCLSAIFVFLALAAVPADLHAAGPFQYHSLTPCRLIDTRNGSGASTSDDGPVGPRTNPGPYDITVKGFCGVPTDAAAVTLNVTVLTPTQQGDLRIANLDASPFPVVSTLNYLAGEPALANGAIVPLKAGAGNDLRMVFGMVASGNLNILVDVTGYFTATGP
jgi:hypothetical protein